MKNKNKKRTEIRKLRHERIMKSVRRGNENICVRIKKTNYHFYALAVDYQNHKVLFSSSSLSLKLKNGNKENTLLVAQDFCKKLKSAKIEKLSLDRGGHRFHGRIELFSKTLAENGIKI